MFYFKNWDLSYDGQVLAMQFDNLTRTISLQGALPDGWDWVMEVGFAGNHDIIQLAPVSGGLEATLTRDNLAFAGWYEMQMRGNQGELERRTNIIRVHVPRSLSGTGQWPTVPTEFTQIEQRIADLNAHPSIPGQNGFWLVWDPVTKQYKESEYPLPDVSVGPAGKAATIEVAETVTGEPGSAADVKNLGDENAARLRFTIPRGQAGPVGATPQISVTVETLPPGSKATVEVTGTPENPEIALGIPQGAQGERGQQGIQGVQGWSVSGAALDEDGALVLTIRNPADGSTQTLPPVAIDNSAALQAVAEAITAQGTAQVQRVETAGSTAVGEVSTAKDAALQAVDKAQTTATGAVSSAQGTAETAIGAAQTAAVEAVEAKGAEEQGKLNAIVPPPTPDDAGKALVANEYGTGLAYRDLSGGAGIDDDVIAVDSTWSSRMVVDSLAPAFSETGSVVTCNPVANYPLSIQAQIVPVQEGTGDPSPDNVRAISGRDGTNLFCGSKNLFDISKIEDVTGNNYYLKNNGDGTLSVKTEPGNSGVITRKTLRSLVGDLPDGNYFLTANTTGTDKLIFLLGVQEPWMFNKVRSLTSADLDSIVTFYASGVNTEAVISGIQIEPGNQATPYTPYNPSSKTITIPFGQAVYGGTLDVSTGTLSVTWGSHAFNAADSIGAVIPSNGTSMAVTMVITSGGVVPTQTTTDIPAILCASLKTVSYGDIYSATTSDTAISCAIGASNNRNIIVRLPLSVASSSNDIKNWLIDNEVIIIYRLADPTIKINLTPQEILALSDVNTIYADTGDVTVSGRADPNAVIQQLAARIAALESAAVANA